MLKLSIRRQVSVLVCAVAAATLGIDFNLTTKPAYASVLDLSCAGEQETTYDPGLTLEQKQTTANYDSTLTCNPLIATSAIVSGSNKGTVSVIASCDLTNETPYDRTYYWSDGQYSKVHIIPVEDEKPVGENVVTYTGLVTEGEFKNDTVAITVTTATLDSAKCASTGVTSTTGAQTITLVRP